MIVIPLTGLLWRRSTLRTVHVITTTLVKDAEDCRRDLSGYPGHLNPPTAASRFPTLRKDLVLYISPSCTRTARKMQ